MDTESFIDPYLNHLPEILQDNPTFWITLLIGFYLLVLGLCLTGALKRQKVSIADLRREQSSIFSMLDEDSSSEDDSKTRERKGKGTKEGDKKGRGAWDGIGCR
ncbi:hypothetical protein QTJ16_006524 [Diplocarpon rosae]|uniref:Transmembrane protein n=1 Tax=Diplocarpon rosae TaxID=946125 RepID=A0AAD9SUD3_9HELO|nr:hypothetical protein QTJ16_006524 [Diplocarpon rosae]PBP23665.1 hypothetical protein BUE80_DR005333 [Diplocarpon rosae]